MKAEIRDIDGLREHFHWLTNATPRLLSGFRLGVDFDLVVNGNTLPFTLEYPSFFPDTPPSVIPRDGKRLSTHQYGEGGELCLEFRSDNWEPSVTGAKMVESTYRLLSGEQPGLGERAIVPSAHTRTVGQQMRGRNCRFLLTSTFMNFAAAMVPGTGVQCSVQETDSASVWVSFIKFVGPEGSPVWQERVLPDFKGRSYPGVIIRLDSLPTNLCQQELSDLAANSAITDGNPFVDTDTARIMVLVDRTDAHFYFSFVVEGEWKQIKYTTIDMRVDEPRLPTSFCSLASKKVGIVGAGSLGSKIATCLCRSGVKSFILVDDDILMPGNLVRHDLDGLGIGFHKVEGLRTRLLACSPAVIVKARRVILGGQESSGDTSSVLDDLATCDLLIDATADPQAFNFVASVARRSLIPMIWSEVFAGGIGGFVGSLRPNIDPPPNAARRQYQAWCRSQGLPWLNDDANYSTTAGADTAIASDAEVSVIAAHAAGMALDMLTSSESPVYPYPAYVVGLKAGWIFGGPYDTRPVQFSPEGEWRCATASADPGETLEYLKSLVSKTDEA